MKSTPFSIESDAEFAADLTDNAAATVTAFLRSFISLEKESQTDFELSIEHFSMKSSSCAQYVNLQTEIETLNVFTDSRGYALIKQRLKMKFDIQIE